MPSASPTTALQRLMAFDFPGNVRQLENLCHWLTVMAPSQLVEAKDLPPELLCALMRLPHARRPPSGRWRAPAVRGGSAADGSWHCHRPTAPRTAAGSATCSARRAACSKPACPMSGTRCRASSRAQMIHTALEVTRGRRIEAAQKLGIGRNTITRKIQELGLDD